MTRYQYVAALSPPAPFVYVTVRNPENDMDSPELPALADSGADRTVIPGKLVSQLHLVAIRILLMGGLGNDQHTLSTYSVIIQIGHLLPLEVEVVAHDDERFILLGRDVLNAFALFSMDPIKYWRLVDSAFAESCAAATNPPRNRSLDFKWKRLEQALVQLFLCLS